MNSFAAFADTPHSTRWPFWLLLLLVGCSVEPQVSPSPPEDRKENEVELRPGSWEDVQRFIASQAGKIVVVNVWSTTCGSCAEEFPRFVELHRKFEQNGIVCVSFNCDYDGIRDKPPEFYRDRVLTFLTSRHATTENYLSTVAFTDLIEPPASLTFPLALVYGRDGTLAKRFDNEHLEADQNASIFANVADFVATLTSRH